MILRADECKARAREARKPALQTKRASTKAALDQAAEYWFGLVDRLEHGEQQPGKTALHLSSPPSEPSADSMPDVPAQRRNCLVLGIVGCECSIRAGGARRFSSIQVSDQHGAIDRAMKGTLS